MGNGLIKVCTEPGLQSHSVRPPGASLQDQSVVFTEIAPTGYPRSDKWLPTPHVVEQQVVSYVMHDSIISVCCGSHETLQNCELLWCNKRADRSRACTGFCCLKRTRACNYYYFRGNSITRHRPVFTYNAASFVLHYSKLGCFDTRPFGGPKGKFFMAWTRSSRQNINVINYSVVLNPSKPTFQPVLGFMIHLSE